MNRGIAQLASVLAWGASGRAFESHYSDTKTAFKAVFFYALYSVTGSAAIGKCFISSASPRSDM